jgi:putative selenium metabolism hydrolase
MSQADHEYEIDTEAMVNFALRLLREPSPSGQEGAVAALVQAEMGRLGLAVDVDTLGNVTGTVDAGPGLCVLLDAHMDTIGVTDPATWTCDPNGERRGNRLYGRGAMDMKGPLAAAVYGAAALLGRLARGRVIVSATVAEELVEGPALVHVAERVGSDVVIICEATSLRLARGQRGRAEVTVDIAGRPTHSSRPELGVNAAQAMVDVVRALRDVPLPRHEVLGDAILVLTDIISRPYPGLSVVPDRCVATFDRRTLPGETAEIVLAPIQEAIGRALAGSEARGTASIAEDDFCSYTGARLRAPNFAPAWFSADAPVVRGALAGLADAGMAATLTHYAFCTNGSGTAGGLGIPTIGFGPGDEELAHRVDECIEIKEMVAAARGYAAMARRLIEGEM